MQYSWDIKVICSHVAPRDYGFQSVGVISSFVYSLNDTLDMHGTCVTHYCRKTVCVVGNLDACLNFQINGPGLLLFSTSVWAFLFLLWIRNENIAICFSWQPKKAEEKPQASWSRQSSFSPVWLTSRNISSPIMYHHVTKENLPHLGAFLQALVE